MRTEQIEKITESLMAALKIAEDRRAEVSRRVMLTGRAAEIRCHREDIPEAMETVIEMLCEDLLKQEGIAAGAVTHRSVASVSRGDTSISYRDDAAILQAATAAVKNYEAMLVHFTKMNLPK